MTPRKKPTTSSESTSGSSSSSSSSNSSSSSGTDSSSSDSENSSASQGSAAKSGGRSTDSDTRKTNVKKKASQNAASTSSNSNTSSAPVASKSNSKPEAPGTSATDNVENAKKATKTRAGAQKANQVYTSDDDDVPSKAAAKRKAPAKPKVSATVTPQQRQTKPPAKSAQTKANVGKANSTAKNAPPKDTSTASKANASKQVDKKNKSIFSPDNSSESDGPSTPSKTVPPKSLANKVSAALNQKGKQKKESGGASDKSPATSGSSGSGSSSGSSSSSDSESSAESTSAANKTTPTTPVKKGPGRPPKKSPATPVRSQARNAKNTKQSTPPTPSNSNSNSNSNLGPTPGGDSIRAGSESEADLSQSNKSSPEKSKTEAPPIRKVTRSATNNARRSKHLIGKSALGSDSDSETEGKAGLSKTPGKKNTNTKAPPRKTKGKGMGVPHSECGAKIIPEEERKCPYEGCDSKGHLSGDYEKHYIIEACPLYHNKTPEECKAAYTERVKRNEERQRLLAAIMERKSPKTHQSLDQRNYMLKVKEMRDKDKKRKKRKNSSSGSDSGSGSGSSSSSSEEEPDEDSGQREPKLKGVAPMYDIQLFQEAQAMTSQKLEEDLKSLPFTKGTKYIEMGKHEMEVWYQSPYPDDYARLPKLYLCEFCLRYMKSCTILKRHAVKCVWRHPPGKEVYRKDKLSVWEVDGKRYKLYCQNLCLLAKFFLDHKTLYYDVEPFLFYVMTLNDGDGCHTVGYFSKEKNSFQNYNVSCILTLPPYQRQGFGRLLIDFSYLLTRQEGKMGSPEKPLSDLGLISYRSYWKDVLLEYLCNFGGKELMVKDISQEMAINPSDIVSTLQAMGMIKYWKGKHIILKKQDVLEDYQERSKRRSPVFKELDPKCLRWSPWLAPSTAVPGPGPA
ncbi:histone acetyltransferase KAT7 isoform X1 [Frankliniella occidentalis]|uniref:Histone acetyltransferase n=1 Tax=Frankliniella occidentalis TaxID=133901 RepID=A0A6J1SPT3_FRAOC|nr:histone acetyltransferase KAT7 isoform X1 [Frankliniella occidentalis]